MTGSMSKKNIKILIVLAGVLVLLLSYLFIYRNFAQKKEDADEQISQLQPELDKLREYEANKQEYLDGIETAKANISAVLPTLPTEVLTEDELVFTKKFEEDLGVDVTEANFSDPVAVEQFKSVTEDTIDDPSKQVDMTVYKKPMTLTVKMDYDQFKDGMDYIFDQKTLKGFDTITADYDAENRDLNVSVSVNSYYTTYNDAPKTRHDIPEVDTGVANPFGTRQAQ